MTRGRRRTWLRRVARAAALHLRRHRFEDRGGLPVAPGRDPRHPLAQPAADPGHDRRTPAALDVISTFDVEWLRNQSVGVYPLKSTSPETMIGELERIFRPAKAGWGRASSGSSRSRA